jgi:hypothetical protein
MNCKGMLNSCPIRHVKICGFILLQCLVVGGI